MGLAIGIGTAQAAPASAEETRAIAGDAYIYAFAMLESYQTLYKQAIDAKAPEYVGGFGKFRHYSEPFTAENHDIVTPNNDTPYSWAWLDLRAEPWVLTVPAVPADRYYVMQFIDLFTQNFAYVGSRATGNDAGSYLVAGPGWRGETPAGVKGVLRSETALVLILTRTALNGPEDVPNVKAIQAQYGLRPLSAFVGATPPPAAPVLAFPPYDKAEAHGHGFIRYLNFLLQFAEPPHPSEVALRRRFETIGIGPGADWDATKVDPTLLAAIDQGVADGSSTIAEKAAHTLSSNGLFGSRDFLKSDYLTRDVAAAKGLYGNSLEEAWYGGYVGKGDKLATIHFGAGQLPPARFFWSLTLYNLPDRFLYANPINRYSIGDRTKDLVYGPDGSLTLYVGHDSPGKDKEANWLPAPTGDYSLVARIYGPKPELIEGRWKLPPLVPAKEGK
jgi:hypothetical protein